LKDIRFSNFYYKLKILIWSIYMSIAYIHHPDCLLHEMGTGHPERPARIHAIEEQMKVSHLMESVQVYEALLATREQLARVHGIQYIDKVLNFNDKSGFIYLDPDTMQTPETKPAALRAAGALIQAVDLVLTHQHQVAFCNIRPPGHHALPDCAMGFCFFNNVAIGTAHALEAYGLRRVAIVDFDVHHGNGTEAIFINDPRVMLCSTFQHPFYPYSGADTVNDFMINVPLPAYTTGDAFREAVTQHWLPALNRFAPAMPGLHRKFWISLINMPKGVLFLPLKGVMNYQHWVEVWLLILKC